MRIVPHRCGNCTSGDRHPGVTINGSMRAAAALGVALLGCACVGPFSEMHEDNYPNSAAARAADPSGWIPPILTDDATSIRDVHHVASNETWGCFRTAQPPAVRLLLVRVHAQKTTGSIANRPSELFRSYQWWPGLMSTGSVEAWEFQQPAVCAACAPSLIRVGIDAAGETVCFHRNPS
jgi:hypothetical protein